jgi:hypothetical protein
VDWLEVVGKERKVTGTALLAAAGLLLLIPILVGYFWRWEYLDVCLWGLFLSLTAAFAGLWQFIREPDRDMTNADAGRYLVLLVGGLFGLGTFILGGFLTYHWWTLAYAGGPELWRKQWLYIALSQGAMIAGMVLMFVSMQAARGRERSNATLRLLLYGTNAVTTGWLLLYVLTAVNVLAYSRMPPFTAFDKNVDWTESSLYTLEPASVGTLRELNKPVKAYVLLPSRREFKRDVEILMNNCRAVNPRFEVEYLSPDLNQDQVKELAKKYKVLSREGILLVTGTEPNQDSEFIRLEEMINDLERSHSTFQGEYALITKLNTLLEGKTKHAIYFTQGDGEPSLDEAGKDLRLGVLRSRLEGSSYEVKPLQISPTLTKIPDDAEVVVVVRPTLPFPENALTALRTYLNPTAADTKRGKLAVAFGVAVSPDGEMVKTGLERLLADFGVQVGNDRILNVDPRLRSPLTCLVTGDPNSDNPVADKFVPPWSDGWADVRTVRPQDRPPMDPHGGSPGNRYKAEGLLVSVLPGSWPETNLRANPRSLVEDLRKPDRRQDLEAKLSTRPLSVAVAVNDTQVSGQQAAQPCLVVFGNAGWLDSPQMGEGRDNDRFALFRSTLSWLRSRQNLGKDPNPKLTKEYVPNITQNTYDRMLLLPVGLTVLGIITVGGGIWLVRRR